MTINEFLFEQIDSQKIDHSNESLLTTSNIMRYLDTSSISKEIFYFYSHELNKILFCLKTVRQIFNYLHQNKMCKIMLIFACYILMKAKTEAKKLFQSLVKRKNKFKLPRFSEFLESSSFDLILSKFKKVTNQARKMISKISDVRRFIFFIQTHRLELIFSKPLKDSDFQKILNSRLLQIITEKFKNKKQSLKYFSNFIN